MHKTTLYLPEELENDIEIAARALGVSKAEFMRGALARIAAETKREHSRRRKDYPKLTGGRPRTLEEMDEAIYQSIKRRASKR